MLQAHFNPKQTFGHELQIMLLPYIIDPIQHIRGFMLFEVSL